MENEIKLLKNNDNRKDSDLEWIEEFYNYLQGEIPITIHLSGGHKPKLSSKKSMAIIWYLQEHFPVFPDTIEKCDNCDSLYDGASSGIYWETKGKFYCDNCSYLVPKNYDKGKK